MALLLQLIADYALGIYFLCALGVLFCLRIVRAARLEREASLFPLEREASLARAQRAVLALVALLATAGVAAFIDFSLGSNPVEIGRQPELETPIHLETSTPAPSPTPLPITPTRPPRPTPIVIETPTPSPSPTPSAPACPHSGSRITSPGVNAVIADRLEVRGTASISQFKRYKLEIGVGVSPSEWSFIGEGTQPVVEGVLLVWDNPGLPPGTYSLRLTVVDQTSNYPPPCEVMIQLR